MKILIVDDHATNLKLLRAQLEAEGHHVLEAGDGVQALAVLEREPVDGIVSDILMPHMDGYGLCRTIRQHPKFSALPLILYTSTYDSDSDRRLAETVGADRYIIKPAAIAVILEALHEARQKAGERKPPQSPLPDQAHVLKQYSEVLVHKLEAKNTELQEALESLRLAHEEIVELNRDLEQRVQERTRELAEANKELESFSYSVSHDLRAPLRSIDGFSQVLLEDCAEHLNEEGKDALQRVRKAATAMGELIDALLALSRVSRVELRAERVDLSALADLIVAELRHSQPDREAEFVIAQGLVVEGDRTLLRAALGNLLGNAWKYTQPRATACIEFGCLKESETVYFVRDNGVGFDMTYIGKLFGAFQRLHSQTEFGGTGVGLATVQRIVRRHGGRAWAEGAVDQGATFYFTLHG